MFRKKLIYVILIAVIFVSAGMFLGCEKTSVNDSDNNEIGISNLDAVSNRIESEKYLEESENKSEILVSGRSDESVALAHAWLEAQGYTYVDSNSAAFVSKEYELGVILDRVEDSMPRAARLWPGGLTLVRTDTMTWQAFENPTHDMTNHTALITRWYNGSPKETAFLELDITTDTAVVIRQGMIIDGEFIPGGLGLTGFWDCLGGGAGSGVIGCAVTNCAYLQCVGATTLASALICGIQALW